MRSLLLGVFLSVVGCSSGELITTGCHEYAHRAIGALEANAVLICGSGQLFRILDYTRYQCVSDGYTGYGYTARLSCK